MQNRAIKTTPIGKKTSQATLNKIWHPGHVEKPPADIIQNIRKDLEVLLWNYRNVWVNRNTTTLPIEMGGLAIMNIESQCKAIQYSILAKFINPI